MYFLTSTYDITRLLRLVMRTITFNLRSSSLAKEALGEGIRPTPFLSGEPWVYGKVLPSINLNIYRSISYNSRPSQVNVFQGIVDINFRVEATDGRKFFNIFLSFINIYRLAMAESTVFSTSGRERDGVLQKRASAQGRPVRDESFQARRRWLEAADRSITSRHALIRLRVEKMM